MTDREHQIELVKGEAQLRQLWQQTEQENWPNPEAWINSAEEGHVSFFASKAGMVAVGFVLVRWGGVNPAQTEFFDVDKRAFGDEEVSVPLYALNVVEDYQDKGHASSLLDVAEQSIILRAEADKQRQPQAGIVLPPNVAKRAVVAVDASEDKICDMYERRGYEILSRDGQAEFTSLTTRQGKEKEVASYFMAKDLIRTPPEYRQKGMLNKSSNYGKR